ncbi:hypothetical protein PPF1_46 [Rhizobium phage vB_RleM_PPF1]|uniref:hypothetical protein n=1 Tax=Rhizobium phage vB_RleM_PPF1 TaxID=1498228 RepID=UPI000499CB54|nr:hypothetical protein PPF1_46 [Rhizobium phage vB_RleM_PPF1]AID18359.1 hypothetical protein PPF1_46 [Rhizobium phage vB_RleM_PPF1]
MATPAEIAQLATMRDDLEKVGVDWSVEADAGALTLCVRDPADGELRQIATIVQGTPFAFQNFLIRAATNQLLALDLLDRCRRAYRDLADRQQKQSKNYATECAMKCKSDQAFRQYLIECHDLRDATDAERIKTRVRSILGIQSMAELNADEAAAGRWRKLRADFERWRSGR